MLNASWIRLGAILGIALCHAVVAIHITSDAAEVANQTFAYVVVGGGTAGLTVASRLAEDPETTILVIEAGPNAQNDTMVNDPGEALVVPDLYNWGYNTTLQPVGGQVLAMTQGKVLGGSSSINSMCWTRGTIDQYNSLEQLGNPGWNFTSLFQYMKKAELYHLPNSNQTSLCATVDPLAHGYDGLVNAGYPQPYEAAVLAGSMVSAVQVAIPGLVHNIDVASGTPNGAARFQYSIKPGNNSIVTADGNTRSSSANAYIYPLLKEKPNLVILVGHQATRLVWGTPVGSLSQATGVKFVATPETNATIQTEFEIGISKEAIVASGGIGSPHFLELSGIGDAQILEDLRIPVEVDLPAVGTNLQDQALNIYLVSLNATKINTSDVTAINTPFAPAVAYLDIEQVLGVDGARVAGDELLQTISSRASEIISAGAFTSVEGMEKILRAQVDSILNHSAPVVELSFASQIESSIIGASYWNLIPQWRGTVHATSNDPSVHPEINPRFFSASDIDLFLKGNATRLLRTIFNAQPLDPYNAGELSPGLTQIPANATDSQWQDFVTSSYTAVYHPIGSVPMLPREDGGAVGPDLIIYGTSNVRVVDSSILPVQISAHLSSTVYGIAEKAADLIRGRV